MAIEHDIVIRGGTIMDGTVARRTWATLRSRTGASPNLEGVRSRPPRDRRRWPVGHARLRGHSYPLRRPGDVGLLPGAIVVARRYHCRDGQLRRRFCAGPQEHTGRGHRPDGRRGGHSRTRLHEGLDWSWESFAEDLTALERRRHDIDFCALLPHAPMRVYVMGDRALNLEDANQEDIQRMREITADAVRAGAFGFSTSRTIAHKTLAGDHTPTLRAHEAELTGIAMGLKDAGVGFIEMTSDWNTPDPATEFAMVRRVMQACGRPLVFSLNERHDRTTAGGSAGAVNPGRGRWPAGALRRATASDRRPARPDGQPEPVCRHPDVSLHRRSPTGTACRGDAGPQRQDQDHHRGPAEFNTWSLLSRVGFERMFHFTDPLNSRRHATHPSPRSRPARAERRRTSPTTC